MCNTMTVKQLHELHDVAMKMQTRFSFEYLTSEQLAAMDKAMEKSLRDKPEVDINL